jgi:hypothetical protein
LRFPAAHNAETIARRVLSILKGLGRPNNNWGKNLTNTEGYI